MKNDKTEIFPKSIRLKMHTFLFDFSIEKAPTHARACTDTHTHIRTDAYAFRGQLMSETSELVIHDNLEIIVNCGTRVVAMSQNVRNINSDLS